MVLHTWGQKLNLHYHVHCVVTGGGLTEEGEWKPTPSEKFLFPVEPLSDVFRGIYWEQFDRLLATQQLELPPDWKLTRDQLKHRLDKHKWVVYAKPPFGGPDRVLKYLGRYTHRVAIANSRIIRFANNMVTFKYKDYRDDKWKVLTLTSKRFLKRFFHHVLPKGLMRIRSYGILSNPKKRDCLARCRELLGEANLDETLALVLKPTVDQYIDDAIILATGCVCPFCFDGHLDLVEIHKQVAFTNFLDSS